MKEFQTQQQHRVILQTKLLPLLLKPQLVERSRLISKLNESVQGEQFYTRMTLVSAPAGFGKTTLVSHWLASNSLPYAWLSLDEDDNDPVRFFTYLVAALQRVDSTLGDAALTMLQDLNSPSLSELFSTLVNEIMQCGVAFILVLDDYHLITHNAIHTALFDFISRLPPHLHLVVMSRVDPPFPLARLRLRHELAELRAADLSFTVEEVEQFFHTMDGLALSAAAAASLVERTEGWAAGLQAAGLTMQHGYVARENLSSVLSGNNRYILDYLAEEVLRQQSAEIQRFLLETSLLDRLCAPLCNAVTNRENAQAILEMLDERNLFIVPLDDERHWYRYHHLFRDFLRSRLERETDQTPSLLHLRASRWYENEGYTEEAIRHALKAEEFGWAAALMARVSPILARGGNAATVIRWVTALPGRYLALHPQLRLSYASALLLTGQVQDAETQLTHVECALQLPTTNREDPPTNDRLLTQVIALRALAACWSGEVARAAALSRHALAGLADADLALRGLMATNLALNLAEGQGASTDVDTAIQVLRRATKHDVLSGSGSAVLSLYTQLGELEIAHGQLRAAEGTYQRALEQVAARVQTRQSTPAAVGAIQIGRGRLHYEWNHLRRAVHYGQEGLTLLEQAGNAGDLAFGQVVLAQAYQAQGERDAANNALQAAARKAQESEIGWIEALVKAMQVRLWLAGNRMTAVEQWADSCGLGVGDPIGYRREDVYLTLIRALSALDRLDEALSLASWLRAVSRDAGMTRSMLKAMVLQALILQRCGKPQDAFSLLCQALEVAEPEGYVRLFIDEFPSITDLLSQAVARGFAAGYASRLLANRPAGDQQSLATEPPISAPPALPHGVEPLSEREREVLRLIAAGLSNREIAETLVIALGTAKRHITNIYGKLDVHNRTQAVARGRHLNLV